MEADIGATPARPLSTYSRNRDLERLVMCRGWSKLEIRFQVTEHESMRPTRRFVQ